MIYELLYIVPTQYSDTEIEGVMTEIKSILEKSDAKTLQMKSLGKMKLAYPIKKVQHGTYVLGYFEVEGEKLQKIELDLKLADAVLRHTIVKREAGIPTEAYSMSQYEAPITPEGKRIHAKKHSEGGKPAAPAKKDPKMSMEELDGKIDAILKENESSK